MSKFNVSASYLRAKEKSESIKRRYAARKRKAKKGRERSEAERKYQGLGVQLKPATKGGYYNE